MSLLIFRLVALIRPLNGGGKGPCTRIQFLLSIFLSIPAWLQAQTDGTDRSIGFQTNFARQAQAHFEAAQKKLAASPADAEAAWRLGQASFDWAEYATSKAQRASIAGIGAAACRELLQRTPDSAAGHYYLGMNLAQIARTKRLSALSVVEEMEKEFTAALGLDPKFDFAGADRNLGLLYHDAPGWPISVGSKSKAAERLTAAVKLAPGYPENLLNLAEARLDWGEPVEAEKELKNLLGIWPAAKKQFTGMEWEASWVDWEKRRKELEKQLGEKHKPTGSR